MNRTFLVVCSTLVLSLPAFAQKPVIDPNCEPPHAAAGHCVPDIVGCPPEYEDVGYCKATGEKPAIDHVHAHINQFMVFTGGPGPRARTGFTAPNMFMLEVEKGFLAPRNSLKVEFMGTTDFWTVPASGTPQILQSGEKDGNGKLYVDAQHPHSSPVMGLTFSNILRLNEDGSKKLTFFFAPRGEATAGSDAFMHSPSAQGNPDAPLTHHLNDFFHISSTVAGVRLNYGKVTFEGSTFSGFEPQPRKLNLDLHKMDSYAFRARYNFTPNIEVGGSVANFKPQHAEEHEVVTDPAPELHAESERATAIAAWLVTKNEIGPGTLNNKVVWGHVKSE
ncbi:MAG: hypothetical protein ABL958_06585, partial [Bdellovibrionia bacterium]